VVSVGEAAKGIYGAWRLAHGDRSGLAWFDTSMEGFWKSFGAAIVTLPAYAALVGLAIANWPGEVNLPGIILVQVIAYVIDWFAFPLAAIYICDTMGKAPHYTRLIVALNWAKVVEVAVMLPAALVASLAGESALALIPAVILVLVVGYHWFVTRVALDASIGEAVMVTVINLTIAVITSMWARSLLL
jgi:hypothetical protein